MATAILSFHPRLISLLHRRIRGARVVCSIQDQPAVKDTVEACGVPHTEIDVLLINGQSVSFEQRLQDQDRVDIFPYGFPPDTQPLTPLCPPLTNPVRFALDVHLGKLTRRLRTLGCDCFYRNLCDDDELIELALSQGRSLLTCDRGILKHARVKDGLLIRGNSPDAQVQEVLFRYRLNEQLRPLTRCTVCNGVVHAVEKENVVHQLLPRTARYYDEFYQCQNCRKLYWKGSHYLQIARWIEGVERVFQAEEMR